MQYLAPTLNIMPIQFYCRRQTFISAMRATIVFGLCLMPFLLEGTSFAGTDGSLFYQTQPDAIVRGKPFTAVQLESLIPSTVYFRGKSAPVQMRNAGGVRFANDGIFFAVMVDTAGYASSVQETYQFYLVTEKPIRFGGQLLPPGAYGAGFVNDKFIVMDIGGKTVLQGNTTEDKELKRPRPLAVLGGTESSVRLYLGRRYVLVESAQ